MVSEPSVATGGGVAAGAPPKRVAIYLVAYNAVHSLSGVLDRIPEGVRDRVDEIFVCDAGSRDDTYLVGVGYKTVSEQSKLTILRASTEGFGASSKSAIDHCRERGYDVVVILHADGKYAPEVIETLIEPVLRGEVDAVFGSRFLSGNPMRSGMPLHKFAAVRGLTALQNRLLQLGLSEYHCGYRAYSVPAIAELPYSENSDGLVFDTEIIIQLKQKGLRIAEVPVPAYSGEETDSLRGFAYGLSCLRALAEYWLHSRGLREVAKFSVAEKYVYRESPEASHQKVLALLDKDRQSILDVGCGAGYLAEALAVRGNSVVGVDSRRVPGVEARVGRFLQVDLDREPIPWSGPSFGAVVLADVLEHLQEPYQLLAQCHKLLADDGSLIVSVPNVAHWTVRLPLLLGRFTYRRRGILDRSHLRFYTLSSIRRELEAAGFRVDRVEATAPPFEELFAGRRPSRLGRWIEALHRIASHYWKELFAYQFVLRARRNAPRSGPGDR
jgi:SAM-dependent methyltransferase